MGAAEVRKDHWVGLVGRSWHHGGWQELGVGISHDSTVHSGGLAVARLVGCVAGEEGARWGMSWVGPHGRWQGGWIELVGDVGGFLEEGIQRTVCSQTTPGATWTAQKRLLHVTAI